MFVFVADSVGDSKCSKAINFYVLPIKYIYYFTNIIF